MNARDYIALMRERKLLIAACVLVWLGLAVLVTYLMPKSYASTATFYIDTVDAEESAGDPFLAAQLPAERAKSYAELLAGPRVAADAAEELGDGTTGAEVQDAVSSEVATDTVVLTLTATAETAERAQAVARAVTDSFTGLVRQLEADGGETPVAGPVVLPEVLQPADLPDSPVSPSLALNLVIGLAVGLLLGLTAAVVRHTTDTRLRSARLLAEAAGAPVLGIVPRDRRAAAHPVALAAEGPAGPRPDARVEAYRRIRTAVQAAVPVGKGSVLLVASASRGEGRTTTACNLAASLAAVGARVVLVDADLRDPAVIGCLDLDVAGAPGLTEVLSGEAPLAKAVLRWGPERVAVITSGAPSARANELLASRRAGEVLAELRGRYDYVVVDSPPVLSVADAASLAAHADGVVLVGRWLRTRRPDVEGAVAYLRSGPAPVLGAVLTGVPPRQVTPADVAAGAGAAARPAPRRTAGDVEAPDPGEAPDPAPEQDGVGGISPVPDPGKQGRRGGSVAGKRQPRRAG